MSKETFYFSHDYNARTDPKIKKLLARHGMKGYGIFWSLIEDLYNNANALPLDYKSIAYDLRVDQNALTSVINDFELFTISNDFFGSKSVDKRLGKRNEKSELARVSAEKRWEKQREKNANALRTQSAPNAIKKRKVKESKEEREITHTPEEISLFEKFEKWISEKAPRVCKFEQPFTIDQYLQIKTKFSVTQIADLLGRMENNKDVIKKNVSAYRTFLNWAERSSKDDKPEAPVVKIPTNLKQLTAHD